MSENVRETSEFQLVLCLASGRSVRDSAEQIGVSERTIYRRLEDPEFRRQVSQARGDLYGQAVGMLADGAADAVTTLRTLAKESKSETVKLNAAKAILELGSRLREATELDERLTEIEAKLDESEENCQQNGHGRTPAFPIVGQR